MAVAFAAKLRMAAAALGCTARKEFCARLRAVNPASQCDLDRLNKWMQGRSLPRASSVYADLALVIGSSRPGSWIADCDVDAFVAELAACTGVEPDSLSVGDAAPRRGGAGAAGPFGGTGTLAGAFAAYSPAWSPHFAGRVLRGSMRLAAGGRGLVATYRESIVGRDVTLTSEAWVGGRSMHLMLRGPDDDFPLFMSLQLPGLPASVLCGVMAGVPFLAHEPAPTACRIVLVRVPESPRLDAGNRYLVDAPGVIASDLADLGVDIPEAGRIDTLVRAFAGAAPLQATTQDQAGLAALLDPLHLLPAG